MSQASTTQVSRFLDLRALACLEHLRFATRHRIEGGYSGRHQSHQQGGAGEFVDFREYVEGEDLRRLDWKVLARTGRAYIRLYQDETNLVCTLVIDTSNSMQYGEGLAGGSKLEYAQYLSTALSQIIVRQQDQIGLALVAEGLEEQIPPGATTGHAARIQEAIERIRTHPVSDLAGGLRDLFGRLARRGVLLIISDFLVDNPEEVFASVRLFRRRHSEVIILHLVHPGEERLPEGLAYRFVGLENEGLADCSPAEIRKSYEERFEAHAATVRTLALATGCDYRRVSTAVPYTQTLGSFLVERSA